MLLINRTLVCATYTLQIFLVTLGFKHDHSLTMPFTVKAGVVHVALQGGLSDLSQNVTVLWQHKEARGVSRVDPFSLLLVILPSD